MATHLSLGVGSGFFIALLVLALALLWDVVVKNFNQSGASNAMHESGDPHRLRCSFEYQAFTSDVGNGLKTSSGDLQSF
ncbi:hypothetical protein Tco_1334006 [Tanacetum coccineum]